ncbi:type 4 pilus major pilin [Dyella psychrodurans]|uniref:Type 4 secretion system PilS N-terminal domain-containing protein n=1 Tax=Dyella psychrodurans TaxID=1927960 RepID=A0A370XCD2_9GAMM|nr:type 4 pilus major pilin [Dyella psychrodurans]RDS85875.1 hypothetical protein DWU99_00955 [Dyella psychrodurans]
MRSRAYTLLEILLVLVILTLAGIGVLQMYQRNALQAAVQKEQGNLAAIATAVDGMFASAGSYAGLTAQQVAQQRPNGVALDSRGAGVLSAFGGAVAIQPTTVAVANDAFQVIYAGLARAQCDALIPAVAGDAYAITIGASNVSVVSQSVGTIGQITDASEVAAQCAAQPQDAGLVTITYYTPKQGNGPIAGAPTCTTPCAPQTQTQTLSCPGSEVGAIEEQRQGTCTGAPCPTLTWGAWTTTASSCATAPTPPGPPTTPTPPTPSCAPTTLYRATDCPAGQTGRLWQASSVTCSGGQPVQGAWTTIDDDCLTPTGNPAGGTGCLAHAVPTTGACPAGEGGMIAYEQNVTCDANGNPVYGPVTPVSNTCQIGCAATGTCCTPSSASDAPTQGLCPAGDYGVVTNQWTTYDTCASATATPTPGAPVETGTSATCAPCPAPTSSSSTSTSTSTETQPQSAACPSGESGSDTWNEVYDVTTTTTTTTTTAYNCAGAPTTLPAPTHTTSSTASVGAPVDTGVRQGEVNSCVASAPTATGNGCTAVGIFQYSSTGPVAIASNPGTGTTAFKSCTCKVTVSYGGSTQQIMVTATDLATGGAGYSGYNSQTFTVGGGSFLFGVIVNATYGQASGGNYYWNSTCSGSVLLPNGSNYP